MYAEAMEQLRSDGETTEQPEFPTLLMRGLWQYGETVKFKGKCATRLATEKGMRAVRLVATMDTLQTLNAVELLLQRWVDPNAVNSLLRDLGEMVVFAASSNSTVKQ